MFNLALSICNLWVAEKPMCLYGTKLLSLFLILINITYFNSNSEIILFWNQLSIPIRTFKLPNLILWSVSNSVGPQKRGEVISWFGKDCVSGLLGSAHGLCRVSVAITVAPITEHSLPLAGRCTHILMVTRAVGSWFYLFQFTAERTEAHWG